MKKSYISVKVGIYDTHYTVRDYGSYIMVQAPYVKWVGNSGSLDFKRIKITRPSDVEAIRIMADRDELWIPESNITLDDILS